MRSVIVIPARYASTRFPGKPLVEIAGLSLIQRVYTRAAASQRAEAVYVATDDDRIFGHVAEFGGKVVKPEGDFQSGTDRIAAALPIIETIDAGPFDIIVNVQGDEPLIDISSVDALIERLSNGAAGFQPAGNHRRAGSPPLHMATLACPLETDDEFHARDVVKVVVDAIGNALYFSRAAIGSREVALRHIGVYAYRRSVLERFVALAPSPLEHAESLEQLRALQHGFKIGVLQTNKPHLGVDRPEDVERVEKELARLHA